MNIRNYEQLLFAFPRATARVRDDYPRVFALHARVRERPKIKAYLESSRRKPFSSGLFRHYPELDDPEDKAKEAEEAEETEEAEKA